MAQHDYVLDDQSGASFRGDLNNALAAVVSQNSGASAPSVTFAYMLWADTTNGLLKMRNAANSAWITIGTLASANLGLMPLSGGSYTGAFNDNDVTLASASTVNIGAAGGRSINISGTTTITAFDTVQAGTIRKLRFAGILTLTYNATSMILPGAANIVTAAGDAAEFLSLGSGNWKCTDYTRASGAAIVASSGGSRNALINGAALVWQRGAGGSASIAVAASTVAYADDRWYLATGANQASAVSQQTGPTGFQYASRVQRNNGQTGTGQMVYAQALDADKIAELAGSTCVLSGFVSTGANWSPSSGTLSWKVYCGTGSPAKRNGSAYTGETSPISGSMNIAQGASSAALSATSGSLSGAIPSNTKQMEVQFFWTPSGTAGANDWFQITGRRLEPGTSAGNFDATEMDFTLELVRCGKFYQKTFPYATAPAQNAGTIGALAMASQSNASNKAYCYWAFPVRMRAAPSMTYYNPSAANANWRDTTGSSDRTAGTSSFTSDGGVLAVETTAGTMINSNIYAVHAQADAEI